MKLPFKTISFLFILVLLGACDKEDDMKKPDMNHDHIEYFGFTLVDTYWDDPSDSIVKTNYSDEVQSFSNMADILVLGPTDNIVARIDQMDRLDMKAVLHLHELFFKVVGTDSPSGADYDLRSDFRLRWNEFVNINSLHDKQNQILTFYMGEEPLWNGISFIEFSTATDFVKNQFSDVPIMLIEAYPIIDSMQVPTSVDWLGFDHYFIKDPTTDTEFQREWNTIKAKRSTTDQKLVIIMDTHYIPWAHGDYAGIEIHEMKDVAASYYDLALSEPSTIAIFGYYWPSGFEFDDAIGARSMPQSVKDEYMRIGKEITGKE